MKSGWPKNAVEMAHVLIHTVVEPGDFVVDATCGNGKDTVFLARLVGEKGKVLAIDVQPLAVERTKSLLQKEGLGSRVTLVRDDHSLIRHYLREPVKAAMFNLGYLPGGDKRVVTRPETTIAAMREILSAVVPGGLVTVVAYTGHPGGVEELEALLSYVRGLPQHEFSVMQSCYINQVHHPPQLIAVGKNRGDT